MSEEQIEIAAAAAGLEIARVLAFRREAGQTMTRPEQDVWDATVRFARIIATQATPDAAEAGKDAIPDVLFDGHAVYTMLSPDAKRRTSAENVSDALDAMVRLLNSAPGWP